MPGVWMEHFKVGPQKYIIDAETMESMQFRNPRALAVALRELSLFRPVARIPKRGVA